MVGAAPEQQLVTGLAFGELREGEREELRKGDRPRSQRSHFQVPACIAPVLLGRGLAEGLEALMPVLASGRRLTECSCANEARSSRIVTCRSTANEVRCERESGVGGSQRFGAERLPTVARTAIGEVVHDMTVKHTGQSGTDLALRYYDGVVRPMLAEQFPRLPHAAGRVGSGSDVLGFDDETSRDHDWGLRLSLFVPPDAVDEVSRALAEDLPETYERLPTRFAFTGETERRHRVEVASVSEFVVARLGFDARGDVTVENWLSLTGQAVLEVTAGPVFADTDGALTAARRALTWYPDDVWRYILACDWIRLAQELPLMSRAAELCWPLGRRAIWPAPSVSS